jgi:HUS1 checkpoint protein
MRFKTELKNIRTFASTSFLLVTGLYSQGRADAVVQELTAALASLEKIAWVRLSDDTARFTVIPDMGSQVWA